MSRPSRIDIDQVLDAAMAVFWSRGYGAASMDALVQATGAARYGLYGAFDGKDGLYLAALGRYQQVIVNRLFAGVEARDAGPEQIEGYFDGLLAMAGSAQGRWGCLMVNAAVERAPDDRAVAAVVETYRARLRQGFATVLARGRKGGADQAEHLVSLSFGISVQARAGSAAADLAAAVRAGLSARAAR